MKRKIIAIVGIILLFAMVMTGCHKQAAEETTIRQATTIVAPYESNTALYKSVLDKLPEGSLYAFADMNENFDALLVTDFSYEDPDSGLMLSTKADVYGLDKDGNVIQYGSIESGGTANPLMVKDHCIYYGGHHYVSKATIDQEQSKLVVETAKDESYGGSASEVKKFDKLYDEYMKGTVVGFTKSTVIAAAVATTQKADSQKTTAKATTKKATQKATTKKATQKATTKKATQKTTEATGSPVQRFQGRYGNGRCTIDVKGVSNNTVEIHVYWASSAWEHSEWTMSGNFDEDERGFYVYYDDCTRKDYKYNDDGEKVEEETVYVGGKGAFRFNGNKMTWEDQTADHIADGMVFTKS